MSEFTIAEIMQPTLAEAEGIARLVPQMTSNKVAPMSLERLGVIVASGTRVYVVREADNIVGVGVLGKVEQLVGTKYWLEDIVVDQDYRRQGVASLLMDALLKAVPDAAYSTNLTSKSSRPDAQAWYERLGFEHKSDVYRLNR